MPVGQGPWARLLLSQACLHGPASYNHSCRATWYQLTNWVGVAGIPEQVTGLTDRAPGCSYIYCTHHWRACLLPRATPWSVPSLVIHSAKFKLLHVANLSRDTGLHRLGLQEAMWPWPGHVSVCRWQGGRGSHQALHLHGHFHPPFISIWVWRADQLGTFGGC